MMLEAVRFARRRLAILAPLSLAILSGYASAASAAQPDAVVSSTSQSAQRNVILFVGDGMGVSTVTAARILAGQLAGGSGEEHNLSFEHFPHVALVKTYNTDLQVPDSAGTMTAMVTGHKTRSGVLSIAPNVERGDCAAALANELTTLLERAEVGGYATGLVSTATITHATPAAAYAHAADRNWEDDSTMPEEARMAGCVDIARQMLEFTEGNGIEVMLGGGRSHFLPKTQTDPEYADKTGQREDGRDLVARWLADAADERHYVWNRAQFEALDASKARQVLGLFEPSHMQFEADRTSGGNAEPSLAAMTEFAITRLSQNATGYFLIVEGGRIDHAHHFGNAYRALTDAIALDAAVAQAIELTDPEKTLILVTADHSHTLTISGYPPRGNPILGKVEGAPDAMGLPGGLHPYTTLGYANGPGYRDEQPDLREVDTEAPDYQQIAAVDMAFETHAGEDVPAYAMGLGATALGGVIEQNEIYNVLADALFGPNP